MRSLAELEASRALRAFLALEWRELEQLLLTPIAGHTATGDEAAVGGGAIAGGGTAAAAPPSLWSPPSAGPQSGSVLPGTRTRTGSFVGEARRHRHRSTPGSAEEEKCGDGTGSSAKGGSGADGVEGGPAEEDGERKERKGVVRRTATRPSSCKIFCGGEQRDVALLQGDRAARLRIGSLTSCNKYTGGPTDPVCTELTDIRSLK